MKVEGSTVNPVQDFVWEAEDFVLTVPEHRRGRVLRSLADFLLSPLEF